MTVTELPVHFTDIVDPEWDHKLEAYLRRFPPTRPQFRVQRRDPGLRPVIVVHTAESGTDRAGQDPKAEGVASFIQGRAAAGSYHLVGDSDSVIQLVRFSDEAFHDATGSNRWSIGISLAMNAGDWPDLDPRRRGQFVHVAACMAAYAGKWIHDRLGVAPAPVFLTRPESESLDASGFISHGRRDPNRRSDPGPGFPWTPFLARYAGLIHGRYGIRVGDLLTHRPEPGRLWVEELQRALGVADDGIVGPVTLAAAEAAREAADKLDKVRQLVLP